MRVTDVAPVHRYERCTNTVLYLIADSLQCPPFAPIEIRLVPIGLM
jgi:hypothetical protein